MGNMEYISGIVRMMVIIMVIEEGCWKSECCLDHERDALLQIKSAFPSYISTFSLSSWGINANCCSWVGVVCSGSSGRVTELYLDYLRGFNANAYVEDWYLNTSLFLPFDQLQHLSLRANGIAGCLKNEGFERLSALANLELLHLGLNSLTNNILPSLATLSHLKSLSLSSNRLEGALNIEGGNKLLTLRRLEVLNLGWNKLNNSVFSSLRELSSLKTLNLMANQLKGSLNLKDLEALSNLEELNLDSNEIHGFTATTDFRGTSNLSILHLESIGTNRGSYLIQSLGAFRNLKVLFLGYNNFTEKLFNKGWVESIGKLTSLKALSLTNCKFIDVVLPSKGGLCELKHLQELDISYVGLGDNLPSCLANLTSLQHLDLAYNNFKGSINSFDLSKLTSMSFLRLSGNDFKIPISLNPFLNLSKLTYLECLDNEIFVETKDTDMIPKFQLKSFFWSGYGYVGAFPKFLKYQHQLERVMVLNLMLGESFPHWLLDNNTNLQTLHLANISLSGSFQLPIHPHWNLSILDVANNNFFGSIPTQIGVCFPKLRILHMYGSGFGGSLPSSFGNMSTLEELFLFDNEISGQIFFENNNLQNLGILLLGGNLLSGGIEYLSNCTSLIWLDISRNNISGHIPNWVGNLPSLFILSLSDNNISGSLPFNLGHSSLMQVHLSRNNIQGSLDNAFFSHAHELLVLDLSYNHLTGSIPSWIGTFSKLGYLLLSHNKFKGRLPFQLCKLKQLSIVDLSHNYLSGDILPCIRCSSTYARLFAMSGSMDAYLDLTTKNAVYRFVGSPAEYISGIDFSSNNFTGNIPLEFGDLSEMKLLNLSNNNLIGSIPTTFSNLSQVESLDLSHNNLQGSIPLELIKLYSLEVFNVSYNNLSGKIPEGSQFATFGENSYLVNPFLYGCPLPRNCSLNKSYPWILTPSSHKSEGFIDMGSFYVSFGVAYVIMLLGTAAVLHINPYWGRAWFYFAQVSMENCYYFIIDNILRPLFRFKFWS